MGPWLACDRHVGLVTSLRMIGLMTALELLIYVMNEAFEGSGIEQSGEGQSLMRNLALAAGEALAWKGHRAAD